MLPELTEDGCAKKLHDCCGRGLTFLTSNGDYLLRIIVVTMSGNGHRLTFLVVEVEPNDALSTRKLLLETAKHNVLTAHSGKEGLEMLKRFPKVDAVAIDAGLKDMDCSRMAKEMKRVNSDLRLVALSPRVADNCEWADRTISSHEPRELVDLLEEFGGRTSI